MTMKTKREIMREIVETTLIKTATTDLEGRYHNGKGKNAIEMIIVQGHILVYKGKRKQNLILGKLRKRWIAFLKRRGKQKINR